jgi:subtilisin family serine protease
MTRGLFTSALLAALVAAVVGADAATRTSGPAPNGSSATEVVVTFAAPPLGRSRNTVSARELDRGQRAFERALTASVPEAHIRWRYRLTLDGVAVALPADDVRELDRLPGVTAVYPGTSYRLDADQLERARAAATAWSAGLANDGEGIKIGIIDGGLDESHPYFDPAGYTMPPGFPKGQTAYTSAKVIVARSFPPPGPTTAAERAPFEKSSDSSMHATHVAGIAAGDADTRSSSGALLSGVAPGAYIGNYRAYTAPTDSGVGEDGNAPEVVAAIEAAVADGMDVINLSIGEAETEPTRDPIALALDGAAAAGVVPVVAAGNDAESFGRGSITSPGSSARAITVGAVTNPSDGSTAVMGSFSSIGPTPLSLRLKPDVVAPGVSIVSSIPGGWGTLSGTSMASPQVAGVAALLRQLHPDWTVAHVKAALVETGDDVWASSDRKVPALPTSAGGGEVDASRAAAPLLFASPSSISFGLVQAGANASRTVALVDAGTGTESGAGAWAVALQQFGPAAGVSLTAPQTANVPGRLPVTVTTASDAPERDVSGYLILTKDGQTRRIPFWLRVTRPRLPTERTVLLSRPGTYTGTTIGGPSRVSSYRYPDVPGEPGLAATLAGPERVYRIAIPRNVANFGVAILARARGVHVVPRVVADDDENRLTGYAALPVVLNPYLAGYYGPVLAAGALFPLPGEYELVFDSQTAAGAGRFVFRYWVDDVTPPTAVLLTPRPAAGAPLVVRVADTQSGVDPATIAANVDGQERAVSLARGLVRIAVGQLAPGRHRLVFQISDYQETRNNENVAAILPNTKRLVATFVVG